MSYSTAACNPLRIRFSDIVLRSLAARIESMMVINDASTSGGTARTEKYQQLISTISALTLNYGMVSSCLLYLRDMLWTGNNDQVTDCAVIGIRGTIRHSTDEVQQQQCQWQHQLGVGSLL